MTPAFQSDPDPDYVADLPERIARGLIKAHENLEPAEIGWASSDNPDQVFNRRWFVKEGETYENPFGITTDRVRMNPGYQSPKRHQTLRAGRSGSVGARRALREGPAPARAPRQLQPALRRRIPGHLRGLLRRLRQRDRAAPPGRRRPLRRANPRSWASCPTAPAATSTTSTSARPRRAGSAPDSRLRKSPESVADSAMKAYDAIKWRRDVTLAIRRGGHQPRRAQGQPGGTREGEGDPGNRPEGQGRPVVAIARPSTRAKP